MRAPLTSCFQSSAESSFIPVVTDSYFHVFFPPPLSLSLPAGVSPGDHKSIHNRRHTNPQISLGVIWLGEEACACCRFPVTIFWRPALGRRLRVTGPSIPLFTISEPCLLASVRGLLYLPFPPSCSFPPLRSSFLPLFLFGRSRAPPPPPPPPFPHFSPCVVTLSVSPFSRQHQLPVSFPIFLVAFTVALNSLSLSLALLFCHLLSPPPTGPSAPLCFSFHLRKRDGRASDLSVPSRRLSPFPLHSLDFLSCFPNISAICRKQLRD